jgi:molybdopterin converting factor small subunit
VEAAELVRVEVRLGAGIHGPSAAPRRMLTLAAGATVARLRRALVEEDPGLADALRVALPVIDGAQVDDARPLAPGDRVAFLLPIAGGAPPPAPEVRRMR